MKHIKFEVSDEVYWEFAAQVNNRVSIPVLDQVEEQVWEQVWNEVWNEIEISP